MAEDEPTYEYGFYDSDEQPLVDAGGAPHIWWYVFGFLPHSSAESAQHTGAKSTWGQPVIVRRTPAQAQARNAGGPDEYEVVQGG